MIKKVKIKFHRHNNHILSAQYSHVISDYSFEQCRYRQFPSLQKVLLESAAVYCRDISMYTQSQIYLCFKCF